MSEALSSEMSFDLELSDDWQLRNEEPEPTSHGKHLHTPLRVFRALRGSRQCPRVLCLFVPLRGNISIHQRLLAVHEAMPETAKIHPVMPNSNHTSVCFAISCSFPRRPMHSSAVPRYWQNRPLVDQHPPALHKERHPEMRAVFLKPCNR